MPRETLSLRRASENYLLAFQGENYAITVGYYDDGRVGEVFINRVRSKTAARLGEALDAACRDAAIMMSMVIQYGANLLDLEHSVTRDEELAPMSIVGAIIDSLGQHARAHAPGLTQESTSGKESQEAQEGEVGREGQKEEVAEHA